VLAAQECGYETIMINCNPETVSTDFDTADCTSNPFSGNISMILSTRETRRVIVQLGGQTALKLAEKLSKYG
jgi:carbamoyl-phosphate synthase large subunit